MFIRISFLKVFVLLSLLFFLLDPFAVAQSVNPSVSLLIAQGQPEGSSEFKIQNQEAIDKLRQMTPQEIEALDKKLAEALVLYYDREFARALPVFKEIADQVETMDMMFWIGTSAMQTGETDLAVAKFKRMLDIDPQLHRVRLELAATYFKAGRYDEARQELETVKAASPPPGVMQNIEKLLAAIDERSKKIFWNLRLSQDIIWDDNISYGPELQGYEVLGGTFTPSTTSAKLRDEGTVTNFAGNFLYDMGPRYGLMWNTALSFYNKAYFDYSEFNYMAVDLSTGPWWASTRSMLKIPVGYTESEYESDRLSNIIHVDPSYEYHFSQYLSLKGLYSYSKENYYNDGYSALDNQNHRFELTPSFYFKNRKHIFSATLGYEDHDADAERYSYSDPYFALSYLGRFFTSTELFLKYQLIRRQYDGLPLFYNQKRDDTRHSYTAVLSQGFLKYFFASVSFNYIDNDCDLELYDYDKTVYAISIGCKF